MDFQRLFDLLPYQEAKYPQPKALSYKDGFLWKSFSTSECLTIIDQLSAGLLNLGLKKGDKVGIFAHTNSPVWHFVDFSLQKIGAIVVPIHSTATGDRLTFILQEVEAKCCFISNFELYEQLKAIQGNLPYLKHCFTFEKCDDVLHWKTLLSPPSESHLAAFQTFKATIHEDDLATIIYTSGTTGQPKGVMLSHKNIISNIKAIISIVPVNCDKRVVSFLPLSHIFERMVTYTYIAVGASLYYIANLETITENFREVRPHYFTSVPRLVEKMYDSILEKGNQRGRLSKKILWWAIALGKKFEGKQRMPLGYWLKWKVANVLIFRIWRRALGNRIEGIIVGAAALQPELARLFSAAGLTIREGYGLTETSPVVALNHFAPGLFYFGTAGIPIPGVEVKIMDKEEDGVGEIWVKGPSVMSGYFQNAVATEAVLEKDGWFKTGDMGKFVHKRFLQITDRKKDIFKTSSGKYVAPQSLENQLKSSIYIEQCMIIGFNRPFVTVLIIPNFTTLQNWCSKHEVHWTAPPYMVLNPKVEKLIQGEIEKINGMLANHEKIQKFVLLHEVWTVANGEITPTLKLIRRVILDNYSETIEKLYK